jgi:uncharacterized repeat protein (TIGR04076 family)
MSNSIRCEAIQVRTESGACSGLARTEAGERYIIDGRTPESPGMCSNAFCALSNAAFIMMVTEKMPGEKDGFVDRVCPHGVVTFRLSRSPDGKKVAYNRR